MFFNQNFHTLINPLGAVTTLHGEKTSWYVRTYKLLVNTLKLFDTSNAAPRPDARLAKNKDTSLKAQVGSYTARRVSRGLFNFTLWWLQKTLKSRRRKGSKLYKIKLNWYRILTNYWRQKRFLKRKFRTYAGFSYAKFLDKTANTFEQSQYLVTSPTTTGHTFKNPKSYFESFWGRINASEFSDLEFRKITLEESDDYYAKFYYWVRRNRNLWAPNFKHDYTNLNRPLKPLGRLVLGDLPMLKKKTRIIYGGIHELSLDADNKHFYTPVNKSRYYGGTKRGSTLRSNNLVPGKRTATNEIRFSVSNRSTVPAIWKRSHVKHLRNKLNLSKHVTSRRKRRKSGRRKQKRRLFMRKKSFGLRKGWGRLVNPQRLFQMVKYTQSLTDLQKLLNLHNLSSKQRGVWYQRRAAALATTDFNKFMGSSANIVGLRPGKTAKTAGLAKKQRLAKLSQTSGNKGLPTMGTKLTPLKKTTTRHRPHSTGGGVGARHQTIAWDQTRLIEFRSLLAWRYFPRVPKRVLTISAQKFNSISYVTASKKAGHRNQPNKNKFKHPFAHINQAREAQLKGITPRRSKVSNWLKKQTNKVVSVSAPTGNKLANLLVRSTNPYNQVRAVSLAMKVSSRGQNIITSQKFKKVVIVKLSGSDAKNANLRAIQKRVGRYMLDACKRDPISLADLIGLLLTANQQATLPLSTTKATTFWSFNFLKKKKALKYRYFYKTKKNQDNQNHYSNTKLPGTVVRHRPRRSVTNELLSAYSSGGVRHRKARNRTTKQKIKKSKRRYFIEELVMSYAGHTRTGNALHTFQISGISTQRNSVAWVRRLSGLTSTLPKVRTLNTYRRGKGNVKTLKPGNLVGEGGLLTSGDWLSGLLDVIYEPCPNPKQSVFTALEQVKWSKKVLISNTRLSMKNYRLSYKAFENFGYDIVTIYDKIQAVIKRLPRFMRRNIHIAAFSLAMFRLLVFKEVNEWAEHIKHWYQKHSYKKHKRIFYTLRRVFTGVYKAALYNARFIGMFFQLKGKVNSKGGLRKRLFRTFHGRFGSSTLRTIFQYKFKQVWCKSGAIGLKTITMHRNMQYVPKEAVSNRLTGGNYKYSK